MTDWMARKLLNRLYEATAHVLAEHVTGKCPIVDAEALHHFQEFYKCLDADARVGRLGQRPAQTSRKESHDT